jgi:hypothetical protein
MSQGDMGDALLMMLIGGGMGGAGGAAAGAGTGAAGAGELGAVGAGAAGTGAIGAGGAGAATGGSAAAASPGIMDMLFPQPQNSMSSQFGIQDPTMAGIMDTIQRLQASPFSQGGIPGENQGVQQIPQGGVMLPKRKTGRMF